MSCGNYCDGNLYLIADTGTSTTLAPAGWTEGGPADQIQGFVLQPTQVQGAGGTRRYAIRTLPDSTVDLYDESAFDNLTTLQAHEGAFKDVLFYRAGDTTAQRFRKVAVQVDYHPNIGGAYQYIRLTHRGRYCPLAGFFDDASTIAGTAFTTTGSRLAAVEKIGIYDDTPTLIVEIDMLGLDGIQFAPSRKLVSGDNIQLPGRHEYTFSFNIAKTAISAGDKSQLQIRSDTNNGEGRIRFTFCDNTYAELIKPGWVFLDRNTWQENERCGFRIEGSTEAVCDLADILLLSS